jgi:hypothetical protein
MKISAVIILFLATSCAVFSNKETAGQFPIYGNWCGPNHPKAGTNPAAIDKTDLACNHHDYCYAAMGYLNKNCDDQLIAELKSFTPDGDIEAIARKTIISYFRKSPKL